MGVVARIGAARAAADASTDPALVQPTGSDLAANAALGAHFDRVISALRDALNPERFRASVRTAASVALRDSPLTVQTLHNPTGAPVTVTLTIDPGGEPVLVTQLAAGQVVTLLGMQFGRLAGFVTGPAGSYVVIAGELNAQ